MAQPISSSVDRSLLPSAAPEVSTQEAAPAVNTSEATVLAGVSSAPSTLVSAAAPQAEKTSALSKIFVKIMRIPVHVLKFIIALPGMIGRAFLYVINTPKRRADEKVAAAAQKAAAEKDAADAAVAAEKAREDAAVDLERAAIAIAAADAVKAVADKAAAEEAAYRATWKGTIHRALQTAWTRMLDLSRC